MPEPTPEQITEMQEKVKNMSPEELKAFQKQQCIFCKILSGEVASKKIYEDDKSMAILDINPANPGHLLLMPKEHYAIMPLIPDKELSHLTMVTKALSHVMLNTLKAEGTNIFIANGVAAGQRAQHFMIHIIPRKEGDGVGMAIPEKQISKKQLSEIKDKVRTRVEAVLKLKSQTVGVEKPLSESEKGLEKAEISSKHAVVEAEFKEKPAKKKPVKTEPAESSEGKRVSLDDIAKLIK